MFWERATGLGDKPRPEPWLKGGTMVVLSSVSIVCCLMFHKYVLHRRGAQQGNVVWKWLSYFLC